MTRVFTTSYLVLHQEVNTIADILYVYDMCDHTKVFSTILMLELCADN